MKVSIIVSTYNKPHYLKWALASIRWQHDMPEEVIVADDGSGIDTRKLLLDLSSSFPCSLKHSWIPDAGFRLSRSRNCAAWKSVGDLLLFVDGDCILAPDYVAQAKKLFGCDRLLNGARKLLTMADTDALIAEEPSLDRIQSFFSGRKFFRLSMRWVRDFPKRSWRVFRGFSMAIPRSTFEQVCGFDERYRSWGLEDSDLAVRALAAGHRIRDGRYALSVLHLYHPEPNQGAVSQNSEIFHQTLGVAGLR